MTARKDVKFVKPLESNPAEPVVLPETARRAVVGREPVGRVVHDARGNAVWKWGGDTSTTGSTTGILEHLDPQDLKVQGTGDGRESVFDAGGGYDPYNQGEPSPRKMAPKQGSRGKR